MPAWNKQKQTTKETTKHIKNGFQTLDLKLHKISILERGDIRSEPHNYPHLLPGKTFQAAVETGETHIVSLRWDDRAASRQRPRNYNLQYREEYWKRKSYIERKFQISGEGPPLSLELSGDQWMHVSKSYHSQGRSHPKGEGRKSLKLSQWWDLFVS